MIGGVPQPVYSIPLKKISDNYNLEIAEIVDRVIIGPTHFPGAMLTQIRIDGSLDDPGEHHVSLKSSRLPGPLQGDVHRRHVLVEVGCRFMPGIGMTCSPRLSVVHDITEEEVDALAATTGIMNGIRLSLTLWSLIGVIILLIGKLLTF